MAQQVYSTLFLAAYINSAASSAAAAYTVPVGRVAVVRSVSWLPDAVGIILFGRTAGGLTTYMDSTQGLAVNQPRTTRMDQVFPAGHVIRTAWISGGASLNVSGFLLTSA